MNKKTIIIILAVVLIPTIIALVWFLSPKEMSSSNVSKVRLTSFDGTVFEYTDESEKEFFTSLVANFSPIEEQAFSEELWNLYTLEFEQSYETKTYYLCLSKEADSKRCLAYDVEANWYRIDPEDAKTILTRAEIGSLYSNNEPPKIYVTVSGEAHELPASSFEWNYLVADGSYTLATGGTGEAYETGLSVSSLIGLNLEFSNAPDWSDIKIFDSDELVFSGDVGELKSFTYDKDSKLFVNLSCKWYEEESKYYYGNVSSEFYIDYDIKASATLDKASYEQGEIAYITLSNAESDNFEIQTTLKTAQNPKVREYNGKKCVLLPISYDNESGNYTVVLKSSNTEISLDIQVIKPDLADVDDNVSVELISASAEEYEKALEAFRIETSLDTIVSGDTPLWVQTIMTPVEKFIEEKQIYWITLPTYGYSQVVDGEKISVKNFGYHYIKSPDFEHISARSIADGKVVFVGNTTSFGTTVLIDHGFGLLSVYGHLTNVTLSQEDIVHQGDRVGDCSTDGILLKAGEAGQLFFGTIFDGVYIDPAYLFSEQATPTDSEFTEAPQFFLQ